MLLWHSDPPSKGTGAYQFGSYSFLNQHVAHTSEHTRAGLVPSLGQLATPVQVQVLPPKLLLQV